MEKRARIVRLPEVIDRTGLTRSSLYRRIDVGEFPAPVSLGGKKAVGWHEHEIEAWINSRPAARQATVR